MAEVAGSGRAQLGGRHSASGAAVRGRRWVLEAAAADAVGMWAWRRRGRRRAVVGASVFGVVAVAVVEGVLVGWAAAVEVWKAYQAKPDRVRY